MNKKTLFSCTLWAIFALNSVAFAAEGSRSQLEEVTSDSLPIEITDVTLEDVLERTMIEQGNIFLDS